MIINKHGSFYIRSGWPTKILVAVEANPHIFSPSQEAELNAIDELGVGRVMIKSMRYWARALKLVNEAKNQNGIFAEQTELFNMFLENDRYFQRKGSLYLLHRELINNFEDAPAWYWLFNECEVQAINKESAITKLSGYFIEKGDSPQEQALEKEFNCLKSTYVSDIDANITSVIDENLVPFFAPINALFRVGKDAYYKRRFTIKEIPIDILYYCILGDNKGSIQAGGRQLSIDMIVDDKGQVGRYFNMGYSSVIEALQILENKGKIRIFNDFGNRHIELIDINARNQIDYYFANSKERV